MATTRTPRKSAAASPYADARVASYVRISHDPTGELLGVTRQFDECATLARRWDWGEIPEHLRFDDNDLSAFNGKRRPGFEKLVAAIERGEVNVVACWHTDRLYRSLGDLLRLVTVGTPRNLVIKPVTGPELDLSTPTGKAIAQILASIAEMESAHKAERQVLANVQRAQRGEWSSANRTFGYTMDGEPLEPEATAYRTAVADVLAGKSIQGVAKEWNAQGLKTTLAGTTQTRKDKTGEDQQYVVPGTWKSPRVRRLLVNPRYAGLKVYQGRVIGTGDWTPLIDEDTHKGVVALVSDPSRIKCTSFERKYIGSGVYECGKCGGKMKAAQPGGRTSRAYVCRDHQHMLRTGQPLDDYVTDVLLWRLGQPDAHLMLDDRRIDIPALQAEQQVLQARLDELADQFAEGTIDASQLRRGTGTLRAKLAPIDSDLAEAARIDPVAGLLVAADGDPVALEERWNVLTPAIQGQIVDDLMTVTVNTVGKGGARGFDPQFIDITWKRGDPKPALP
jgi:site-specific DNA recombinase